MIYELVVGEESGLNLDLIHDNPASAGEVFWAIRAHVGDRVVMILRDEKNISEAHLSADVESYEIQRVIEQECQLPSTYRQGRGGNSDLAIGGDGHFHGVWKPKNPEDNYD